MRRSRLHPEEPTDRVATFIPAETWAFPGCILRKERSDPVRIIVVVAQGCVARFKIADRLGVLQRLEPSLHSLKPCQIEGIIMLRHHVVLPEEMRSVVGWGQSVAYGTGLVN